MLIIYNNFYEPLAFDAGLNNRIEITVRANQTYYIKLTGGFDGSAEYEITVRQE